MRRGRKRPRRCVPIRVRRRLLHTELCAPTHSVFYCSEDRNAIRSHHRPAYFSCSRFDAGLNFVDRETSLHFWPMICSNLMWDLMTNNPAVIGARIPSPSHESHSSPEMVVWV